MFAVEIYAAVRDFVLVQGNSRREAARVFGVSRDTIAKMCVIRRRRVIGASKPPVRPKLDPFIAIIDAILKADKRGAAQAAPYREADLRASARRARLYRRHHDRDGLCSGSSPAHG